MKINRILALTAGAVALLASCSDFEEINKNPKAASASDLKPYWALDKAIVSDQQNPNDAERVFVLYWGDIARLDGENSSRAVGRSNDEWAGCLYNLTRNCVTSTNNAIKIADDAIAGGELGERETGVFNNVKAASRIWRVYLMTEFVDSFGCFTTDFESTSPEYKSVEECYKFMLAELAESVAAIDVNFPASTDAEKKGDPAYQLDPAKWKNFGISMWMRLAMRLSEVEPATAKAEFEKAVAAGPGIRTIDGTFRIQEKSGWWDLSGVMSRTWDWLTLSMTTANLMTNLGGAKAEDILKDPGKRFYKNAPLKPEAVAETYGPYIKDASTYLGVHMVDKDGNNLYESNTDSPTWGYFFDGIPSKLDPRALVYFTLPSDYSNRIETGYASFPNSTAPLNVALDKANNSLQINTSFAWNGLIAGYGRDDKAKGNGLVDASGGNYGKTYPALAERYRNSKEFRVFFGPWETYFLLAEAAVRGWNAGMGAQAAYEAGIKASFEYLNVDANYEAYINSEDYNRVGTSVKFTHTEDPVQGQEAQRPAYEDHHPEVHRQHALAAPGELVRPPSYGPAVLGAGRDHHGLPVSDGRRQDRLSDWPEAGLLCPAHELPELLQERQPGAVSERALPDGHDQREHHHPAVVGDQVRTSSPTTNSGDPSGPPVFFYPMRTSICASSSRSPPG